MTQSDRIVGRVAWWAFWAIIGSISLVLNLYYRLPLRIFGGRIPDTEPVRCSPVAGDLDVQQRTSI